MPVEIKFDPEWDPDSVYLRFNLSGAIDQEAFEQAVDDWFDRGVDGAYGPLLHYTDEELDWYEGELGHWVEIWADLGNGAPDEYRPALEALRDAVSALGQITSIQVGSDFEIYEANWPRPPEPD